MHDGCRPGPEAGQADADTEIQENADGRGVVEKERRDDTRSVRLSESRLANQQMRPSVTSAAPASRATASGVGESRVPPISNPTAADGTRSNLAPAAASTAALISKRFLLM